MTGGDGEEHKSQGPQPVALVACEGALLVVDATQGIEAQTLANLFDVIDEMIRRVQADVCGFRDLCRA